MPSESFNQIRRIDNTRSGTPFSAVFFLALLLFIIIWFFRGGSFRLYASIFFSLYFVTRQIWLSVILIGIVQNLMFLPLHFIWLKMSTSMQALEDDIDAEHKTEEQYLVFRQKVRRGDFAATFYIFNFIVNAIAFFSAGRIFLIDFYTHRLDPALLYSWVPYPKYPLQGTLFHFPFFRVNETMALDWKYILYFWLGLTLFLALIRLLWRLLKIFLSRNQRLLHFRIGYNRVLLGLGGIGLTLIIISTWFLRHIPVDLSFIWLTANLTRQNSTMNLITAIGTFLTAIFAGYKNNKIAAVNMFNAGIDPAVISRITRSKFRQSFKNGVLLGIGAYLITSQIPSAFELSVAVFEILYILSPYTFDKFLTRVAAKTTPTPSVDSPPASS